MIIIIVNLCFDLYRYLNIKLLSHFISRLILFELLHYNITFIGKYIVHIVFSVATSLSAITALISSTAKMSIIMSFRSLPFSTIVALATSKIFKIILIASNKLYPVLIYLQ